MPLPQVELFNTESWDYFQRNYQGKDLRSLPANPQLERLLGISPVDLRGGAVLDVGCTPGVNLHALCSRLNARRGVGLEPAGKVVEAMAGAFPEYEFYSHPAHRLPFASGEFDLVVFIGVLAWVDRDYLMQTLGEAVRVTSGCLLLADFSPAHPYSVDYHHRPGYRTFKMDYRPLVEGSGLMRLAGGFDLFPEDPWRTIRYSLFRKLDQDEAFPLREASDFAKRG